MADSWPPLLAGRAVVTETRGMNLPIAGFATAAEAVGADLVPILWASAEPSGPVTDEAFETITGRILTSLSNAGAPDALYLDLHGAMIAESLIDGEGALLAKAREAMGDNPIVVSLDLHANISAEMARYADYISIYRTYPHLDMADTGARAFAGLAHILKGNQLAKAFRQAPFLVPLHAQHTCADPARGLYEKIKDLEMTKGVRADLAMGFTAGDTPDTRAALVVYAESQSNADNVADAFLADLLLSRDGFETGLLTTAEAAEKALRNESGRPVIIADVQDNPGAGGSSDTTGILRELIERQATGVLAGLLHDPAAAKAAHAVGKDRVIEIALGGHSGVPGDAPLTGQFRVVELGDGNCVYTGEMYGGGTATLGPTAVLSPAGTDIMIVVTSVRNQCLDLAHFTHIGLNPARARIILVKSTAHFRADFEPIGDRVLLAASPGHFPCVLKDVRYRNLPDGVARL